MSALALAPENEEPAERARANLGSYFSTDDYPAGALARGAQGTVGFELEIGADGRVSRCTVAAPSGDPDLDAVTCAILSSRATYSPARDAQGHPTVGRDRGSVTWRLPDDSGSPYPPFAPLEVASTMRRSADGAITCGLAVNGRPTPLSSGNSCSSFQGSGAAEALQSAAGAAGLTLIWSVLPDQATPSPGVSPEGQMLFDTRARIVIAPDGSLAECHVTETVLPGLVPGLLRAPDLCAMQRLGVRPMFQPDSERSEGRRGELRLRLYFQSANPTTES